MKRILTLLVLLSCAAWAHSEKMLPFQGRLTDQRGVTVPDGIWLIQFRIYDTPVGGTAMWSGEVHRTTINGGLLSVLLGTKTSLENIDFNRTLYLDIVVDANADNQITSADPPLLPRQSIIPAMFATESDNSRKLKGYDWSSVFSPGNPEVGKMSGTKITDASLGRDQLKADVVGYLVPKGAIIMWSGTAVPEGWMLCDGKDGTPDLTDRFVLGTSDLTKINQRGGSQTHDHGGATAPVTLTINQIPAHDHGIYRGDRVNEANMEGLGSSHNPSYDRFGPVKTLPTGGGQPHSHGISPSVNLPPYFVLAFIMKK